MSAKKIKIEICKARNTKGNALMIDEYTIAGYTSGFGYSLIDSFDVDVERLKEIIKKFEEKSVVKQS